MSRLACRVDNGSPVIELRPETQAILQRAEEITGVPVEVMEDSTQSTLARITRARGGARSHLLRVNPTLGEPDYLITYECGFMLRLYKTPSADRREFAGTAQGRDEVERLVRRSRCGPIGSRRLQLYSFTA